jgi:hypothetical protein
MLKMPKILNVSVWDLNLSELEFSICLGPRGRFRYSDFKFYLRMDPAECAGAGGQGDSVRREW